MTAEEDLRLYAGARAFDASPLPSAAVFPANGEEVQKLVLWAKEAGVPLVPVSSAAPHRSPASAPSVPGAVIVDLSRMKKIHSINRRFCMAVIEPGVTYGELRPALAKEGLTINLPVAPRPGKSVIADLLEVTPRRNCLLNWNYIDPLRCTEVTWGDGQKMFTGEAGGGAPDLKKQQSQGKWQINGGGPMMLDFCRILAGSQGTTGIVTWASVKCEPIETVKKVFVLRSQDYDPVRRAVQNALKLRFSDGAFLVNGAALYRMLPDTAQLLAEADGGAAWTAVIEASGREILPEMRVAQQEEDLRGIAAAQGLVLTELTGALGETAGRELDGSGFAEGYAAGAVRLPFVTTLGKAGEFAEKLQATANQKDCGFGLGLYIQPLHQGVSAQVEVLVPELPEGESFYRTALAQIAADGGYYERPYGDAAKIQFGKDPEAARTLEKLYDIFDPARILNPGKLTKAAAAAGQGEEVQP
ncbi:MAG: FAD-binding oxidoreductase [Lachnospiraceae bacterium]|nr:FAD-binding oxidoreductase [Lachnospiraceae bacterium]